MRYSTVVYFSFKHEFKIFDNTIRYVTKFVEQKKRNMLEKAVIASHDTGVFTSLKDFRRIVSMTQKTDIIG